MTKSTGEGTMKITSITAEQAEKCGAWAKQWIEIGLSTAPADFDRATDAALKAYALCNLERPTIILRMSSPYGATVGGALAWALLREAGSQVRSQVGSLVGSQVRSGLSNYRGGAFWAGWGAYISFMRDVLGWRGDTLDKFEIDEALIKSCGWVWWHEDVLAISDRPSEINRDEQGRLHNQHGPSIAYRDGWALYHWHGVAIPAEWITDPSTLTAAVALSQSNVELRRAACEMLGWATILRDLNARAIDADSDPLIGTLVEVDLPDVKARFLRVTCGTGREFAICVPPSTRTALAAQAWMVGLNTKSFKAPEIRT
ncbi:DUF6745 domain-containing protein [Hyphomicrobium sp. CS1GBMeth3]|uniref:DUF6745 domain-containing protein n=1 Tax=Hyphomicrobium sp. CS1GBMeth3 TaxID=1892845 RepID=UPI000A4AE853|nr:hypothetical protein [Hyphomicrobium sp. CS1GBMeth3]